MAYPWYKVQILFLPVNTEDYRKKPGVVGAESHFFFLLLCQSLKKATYFLFVS